MDRQRISGAFKMATGRVKEKFGHMIGDRRTEMKGKVEYAEGRVRSMVGHAKDAMRGLANKR